MGKYEVGQLLSTINSPEDLRKLTEKQLPQLANEVRQYMIDVLSEIGNSHFAASLGVVELTVALHYVFNTPDDQLVWDVGHQAYGHKILTGRRDIFPTNRTKDGISGFPKRSESNYDTFGVGHSSTSISAALGMAIANRYKGKKDRHHIAVIGDGAMTAGIAFEGLNHAGFEKDTNLLVILNDNNMSIDPDVGALREYLSDITASPVEHNIFEALNFQYYGPVDGHDVTQLTKVLNELKSVAGPKILHCITKKGKGFKPAETGNPAQWHAPGAFNKKTGEIKVDSTTPQSEKYQNVFGNTLVELAEQNSKIMGITPAMPTGSSLNIMMKKMPKRAFDVGIAEQHAVTFSAGLATQDMMPFCVIYSTFMQRAYDQLIHDVAIQNLNVVFCLDRAGLVGADGATHHGAFDLAYLRSIPNMTIASPINEQELRNLMFTAQQQNRGPFCIRYPRGRGVLKDWKTPFKALEIGKGQELTSGSDLAIITIGHVGNFAQKSIKTLQEKGYSVAHYDMRFLKPLDEPLLNHIFSQFKKIITVEDGCIIGGLGSAILEFMADNNHHAQLIRLGIPDRFISHGTQKELHIECGFDADGIVKTALQLLSASFK